MPSHIAEAVGLFDRFVRLACAGRLMFLNMTALRGGPNLLEIVP